MTTSDSPPEKIRAQAKEIAAGLKRMERREVFHPARNNDSIKFAIAMDDKMLSVEMRWDIVASFTHEQLEEFIYKEMRGESQQ